MKKLYFVLTAMLMSYLVHSQQTPYLHYSDGIGYGETSWGLGKEFIYNHDSILCVLLNGGMQELNTNTGKWQFRFHNIYNSMRMSPDTGTNIILLKTGNAVYVYNYATDSLTDISPMGLGQDFHDIGRSATETWLIADTNRLARYNGQHWIFDTTTFNVGYKLLVQNDSTAFFINNTTIIRWCNGSSAVVTAMPPGTDVSGWDIDTSGNIWVAAYQILLRVSPAGFINILSDTVSPFHNDQINAVLADDKGNIWCQTLSALYKFNGQTWTEFAIEGIAETSINRQSGKVYTYYNPGGGFGNDAVATIYNDTVKRYYLPNRPFGNIMAGNANYLATNEGIFSITGDDAPFLTRFIEGIPYAKQVTCFETVKLAGGNGNQFWDYPYLPDSLYGTTHGVYSATGVLFPNYLLPDTNVNFITCYNNETYVGTNKGYCIIGPNGVTYLDTANAPLPSNKVTAIAFYLSLNDTTVCVGTDNGFAMKSRAGWQVYDTGRLNVSSFYVSDIEAGSFYNDSAFWISSLGNGLAMLGQSGNFSLLNSSNGMLQDDSVFYINIDYAYRIGCGPEDALLGTARHGVVYQDRYNPFVSDTVLSGKSFRRCQVKGLWWMTADSGFVTPQICGGVSNVIALPNQLRWHQEGNTLEIFLPESYNGKALLTLYDLQGSVVGNMTTNAIVGNPVTMPAAQLSSGLYILQCTLNNATLYTKLVYNR